MTAVWIVVGLAVAGALVAVVTSLRKREADADMGTVSSQWVAEQRLGQSKDNR